MPRSLAALTPAWRLVEGADRRGQPLVRFYLPPGTRWQAICQKTTGFRQYLADVVRTVARENPRLQGVVEGVDFNATAAGQRIIDDPPLAGLMQVLSRNRLGLEDVGPNVLGRAHKYILR